MIEAVENQNDVALVTFDPRMEMSRLASIWIQLSQACNPSLFLSWPWIENWLHCLPSEQQVVFFGLFEGNKPLAGFLVGLRKGIKHKVIYAQRGYLNCTGSRRLDEITIEQNGLLINGDAVATMEKLKSAMIKENLPWDELICNAITDKQYQAIRMLDGEFGVLELDTERSYFVDLDKVRQSPTGLIALLGKSKRNTIRRTTKAFQAIGPLSITEAVTRSEYEEAFSTLEHLHQKAWTERGEQGSFSDPFFEQFHKRFVFHYLDSKFTKLVTCKAGNEVIGVLYCFVHNNEVLFYQCGLKYRQGNHYRPGILSHYLAINYFAEQGYSRFDFLAGECRYKQKLATDSYPLYWCKVQRRKLRFSWEKLFRGIKQKIRS